MFNYELQEDFPFIFYLPINVPSRKRGFPIMYMILLERQDKHKILFIIIIIFLWRGTYEFIISN